MMIHIWMHWFWITTFICKGFVLSLSRHGLRSSSFVEEAGLSDASIAGNGDDFVLLKDIINASHEDRRLRRTVEDEDVGEETTTVMTSPGNETVSNETTSGEGDVYHGVVGSDVEDTYNGGNADGFQYPLKKYMKYGKYNKIKPKPKSEDVGVEEGTTETNEMIVENATVPSTGETVNQTARANESVAQNTTVEVDFGSDTVNKTEEETAVVVHEEENLTVENKVEESVVHTTVEPFLFNNRVAAATSSESRERLSQPNLDAGSITGITLGIVVLSGFIGAISFVLYRRRYLNKPQALNDKCSNLDSSGYIDDTSLRENSEEMYSLDNDSFLNSLEAMTIQNYWTENVKHTKL